MLAAYEIEQQSAVFIHVFMGCGGALLCAIPWQFPSCGVPLQVNDVLSLQLILVLPVILTGLASHSSYS